MIPDMLSERLRLSIGEDRVTLLTTNSAEKALALLFEQPVDLLLTDYDFSQGGRAEGMNGLALCAIEQHRMWSRLPQDRFRRRRGRAKMRSLKAPQTT